MSTRAAIYDGNDQLMKYNTTEIFHLEDFLVSFRFKVSAYFFSYLDCRKTIKRTIFFLAKQRFTSTNEVDDRYRVTSQCDEIFVAVRPRLNHALGSGSEAAIINFDVVKATRWHRNAIDEITLVRIKPFILLVTSIIITIVEKYRLDKFPTKLLQLL